MPVVNLSPVGGAGWQFFTSSGAPLTGGLIYTYAAGTTTPLATYTSATGVTANTNPVVLDAAGRPPSQIWLTGVSYKLVLKDATNVQIWSMDNLAGLPAAGTQSYQTATQGQTVFSGLTYAPGNNSLKVFVNGSKQVVTLNYTETTANSITFLTGLNVGDIVEFLQ
jgi:hypothetical protein